MEGGGNVVDVKGSNRRKCGLLALLLGGAGSVLLIAIAVTAGVTLSSSDNGKLKFCNFIFVIQVLRHVAK